MTSCEVAIVGAGPSGSIAARLLASWGHRVVLLHRPQIAAPALAESLPPSCQKLFDACGVLDSIDGAGFYRSTGNTVYWGSEEPRRELFDAGALGYQVDRSRFDELMRRHARNAGAEVREGLAVDVGRRGDQKTVAIQDAGDLTAQFVLDCSGRAGVVARHGWRSDISAQPRTVALVGTWMSERGWTNVDPTHTVVESHDDGWVWSVPLSPQLRYVTAMVDPQRTQLARGRPALDVYRAELAKTRHMAALVRESSPDRGPWGCDASVYTARTYAAEGLLLVGDAASFIDPLSSYGVKKAMASAWLAAIAVHTSLRTPAMTDAALNFFAAREREMASTLLRQSREQFEAASGHHPYPFWNDRSIDTSLPSVNEVDVRALRDDPRVQRAFEWLKAQPSVALRTGAGVRRAPYPRIRGREIVIEEQLVADAWPNGVRFLRDVDLAEVASLSPAHDQVPALFEAYNRRCPPVALPDFLGALAVMVAFGLLEDSGASAG